MEPQFEELAKRITDDVTNRLTANVERIVDRAVGEAKQELLHEAKLSVEVAKQELLHQAKVNVEEAQEQAKTVAENYGGVLDGIHRQLQDLNSKADVKFRDHDRILTDHNSRITKLEKRD